jgi:hypothetical protein
MNFQQTVRITTLETYIEEYMNLRWVNDLELVKNKNGYLLAYSEV